MQVQREADRRGLALTDEQKKEFVDAVVTELIFHEPITLVFGQRVQIGSIIYKLVGKPKGRRLRPELISVGHWKESNDVKN